MVNAQQKQSTRRPIAVVTSDVHFDLSTLAPASAALTQAVDKANSLGVQLIVAGDIHNSKANIRGECIKAMMDILERADIKPLVIVANHDRINEKSPEHSLQFLRNTVKLIERPEYIEPFGYLIPYYHDPAELQAYLDTLPRNSTLIMHQGVQGSLAGDYIIDKSALLKEEFADFRVISGHYHTRQNIKCGRPQKGAVGLFSYIGNPYTLGFGEANDPEKGFQILMDNGLLEFVPTNLRKHVIIDFHRDQVDYPHMHKVPTFTTDDVLWVKMHGTKEALASYSKKAAAVEFRIRQDFRLDLIPDDTETKATQVTQQMTSTEALDTLIQSMDNVSDEQKTRLKELWRQNASN